MRASVLARNAVLTALTLTLFGCGETVQIVRAPFISPIVAPAPEVFMMNVAVKNYHASQTSGHLWLRVYSEYWPAAQQPPGEPPCSHDEFLDVGVLGPDESWGHDDYRIDRGGNCLCLKDACVGHVWLSLHDRPSNSPPLDGDDTALHVNWVASGDLAQMTVSEF